MKNVRNKKWFIETSEIKGIFNESISIIFYTESSNKNKNEKYDINISSSLINFENLVLQFYQELWKDLEMNQMNFLKINIYNKWIFLIYYHQNNIILFKIFQNYSDIIMEKNLFYNN